MPEGEKTDIWVWLSRIIEKTVILLALLASVKTIETIEKIWWPDGNLFVSIIIWIGYSYIVYLLLWYIFSHTYDYLIKRKPK